MRMPVLFFFFPLSFVSAFHWVFVWWCFHSPYHLIQWQNPGNTCVFRMNLRAVVKGCAKIWWCKECSCCRHFVLPAEGILPVEQPDTHTAACQMNLSSPQVLQDLHRSEALGEGRRISPKPLRWELCKRHSSWGQGSVCLLFFHSWSLIGTKLQIRVRCAELEWS